MCKHGYDWCLGREHGVTVCRPCLKELQAENERLRLELHDTRCALDDCMSYVDIDNLTMQTKYKSWSDVLNGEPYRRGNVEVKEAK